jgi:hypothetical protein
LGKFVSASTLSRNFPESLHLRAAEAITFDNVRLDTGELSRWEKHDMPA